MQNKKIIFVNPKKRRDISNTHRDEEVTAVTINTFLFLQRLSRIDLIKERNSFKGFAKQRPRI